MKHVIPLQKVAYFFGLLPFYDWSTDKSNPVAKIRSYLIFLAMILAYCGSIYGRKTYGFYNDKKFVMVFMEELTSGYWMASYVLAFVELMITKTKLLKKFLASLDSIDAKLKNQSAKRTRRNFHTRIIFVHVYLVVCFVATFMQLTRKYGKFVSWVYICKDAQLYFAALLMLLAYHYAECLAVRFKRVNFELGHSFLKGNFKVLQIYLVLLDTLDLFNAIFGWQFLFLSTRLVMDTLYLISVAVFLLSTETLQMSAAGLAIVSSKVAFNWILLILLVTSCNKVTKEVRKTIEICYKLIHDMRGCKITPQSKRAHRELFLLVQKISLNFCISSAYMNFD